MTYNGQKSGELPAPLQTIGSHRLGVVLCVDDEAPLLVALERRFRNAGYHPLTTTTIEGAWKILGSSVVHCLIVDERLPDGSGAYFLVDVGAKYRGIGRILLTGFLEPYAADLAREHRFPALEKDCTFPELLKAVRLELGADA